MGRSGQSLFKRAIETSFSLRSVFLRGEAPPYPSIFQPFPFSTSYHHPHPPPPSCPPVFLGHLISVLTPFVLPLTFCRGMAPSPPLPVRELFKQLSHGKEEDQGGRERCAEEKGFRGNKRSCELFRDTSRGFLKRRGEAAEWGAGVAPLALSSRIETSLSPARLWLLERQDHCPA